MWRFLRPIVVALYIADCCTAEERDIPQVCGDCWCTSGNNTCPEFSDGFNYELDIDIIDRYKALQINGDHLKLRSKEGGNCYPFADSWGPLSAYPESKLPPCQTPPNSTLAGAVCAFKYTTVEDGCASYTMHTYESKEKAVNDGASVSHQGHCGVCSSAQDLAVLGASVENRTDLVEICGLIRLQKQATDPENSFQALIDCHIEKLGFSSECSILFSHYSAMTTNSDACLGICSREQLRPDPVPNSGEPPFCPLSECIHCIESKAAADMLLYGGRNLENSGLVTSISRECEIFYPIKHDPPKIFDPHCIPKVETSGESDPKNLYQTIIIGFLVVSVMCWELW